MKKASIFLTFLLFCFFMTSCGGPTEEEKENNLKQIEVLWSSDTEEEFSVIELVENEVFPKAIVERKRDGMRISPLIFAKEISVGDIVAVVKIKNTTGTSGQFDLITVITEKQ